MDTLRGTIVTEQGYTFIALDASQIEWRVLAILSQDPQMLADLDAEDQHMATAIRMYGWIDNEEEMKVRRYKAKQGNFADVYGIEDEGLAKLLGCSLEEVMEFRVERKRVYPRLYEWMEEVKTQAKEDGYVINPFGRIRPLPELYAGSWRQRQGAEKKIVNTLSQGTAADIVKLAGIYLCATMDKRVKMVLQVHDEWLLEVPKDLVEGTLALCRSLATIFPQYPFTIKTGRVYSQMEDI